jgi:hypothetical protein
VTLLWYAVVAAVASASLSLALGVRRSRQWKLALAGPMAVAALIVAALARGCPPNAHECSAELTLFIGGFLGMVIVAGWFAGIGIAELVRRARGG